MGARAMRSPCQHTHYHTNGLVHTPMGTCDCPPKSAAEIRAEIAAYVAKLKRRLT